ncbi:MAG: 30S ribosomal protein S8 [Nitrospirae bacterium]|nr:MAG: 30S ribosomal protein S8 [Nitrospirota bacterium]
MSMTDPIADLLTRIRNAVRANHETVRVPHSRLKEGIVRILEAEGYIAAFAVSGEGAKREIEITLKPSEVETGENPIHGLERVSRPGRRVYAGVAELPRVLNGLGIAIVSTSKGLMTDRQARRAHLGGEVVCNVW